MARLDVELLGGFSVRRGAAEPCILPTRKSQALLAYLAMPPGRFHSRDKLAALLWGEAPEARARQSFRQALAGLRRALSVANDGVLIIRADAVALDPASVTVDVSHVEAAAATCDTRALERIAVCYKGEFLAGLRIGEQAFEDWRAIERERLQGLALKALTLLLDRQSAEGSSADAELDTASRLLAMDPLREDIHRKVMQLLLREGRRAAALRQYQICVGWLDRELGIEPEEQTRALYREILRSTAAPHRAVVPAFAPGVLWASGDEAPMVGRDAESERLRQQLGALLDDGGRVVLVAGEAGIGKTRLLHEFARDAAARGLSVAVGVCHESEQILPLRPWADALRQRLGDAVIRETLSAGAVAQLGRIFPELLPPGEVPSPAGEQLGLLFEALVQLLATLTREGPLVLILEDLHWADSLSARFVAFLARRIARLPVLIVGSLRPEDLLDAPILGRALDEMRAENLIEEIMLGPLLRAEAQHLAAALKPLASQRNWQRIISAVLAVSEGNPFIIVESLRAARDPSFETTLDGVHMPGRIEDFVARRLARLGDAPLGAVAAAAVIGREFSFPLLTAAAELSDRDGAAAIEELVRRRILVSVGDRLDFAHDWIRRVTYDRVLPQRRQLLHAAVGSALERLHNGRLDEVADQLGHHYARASEPQKAIAHLVRFSELAVQSYALDDALKALRQAAAAVEALSADERDRTALDIALRQAFVLSSLARPLEVRDLLRTHADKVARLADPSLASEYHFRLGLTSFYLGERAASRIAAEQALLTAERLGEPERIGKALHVLSLTAYDAGKPDDGIAHASRAVALLRGLPSAHIWLGLAYFDLALNSVVAGALASALDAAGQADLVGGSAAFPRVQALAGYVSAWAHALRGDIEAAITTAERSLSLSRDPTAASLVSGALGLAYIEKGDGAAAVGILTKVVEQPHESPARSGDVRHMVLLAEARLLAGDLPTAREAASRGLKIGQTYEMKFNVGLAERALGRIALAERNWQEAASRLGAALATLADCGAAFEAARTRIDLLRVPPVNGHQDWAAQGHVAAALSALEAAPAPRRVAELHAVAQARLRWADGGSFLPDRPAFGRSASDHR